MASEKVNSLPVKDEYKLSKIMYVLFAAFEYFISTLCFVEGFFIIIIHLP